MIITYKAHKSFEIENGKVNVIATSSPIAYCNLIEGIQEKNELLCAVSEDYDAIPLSKAVDWLGDPLISESLLQKYMTKLASYVVDELSADGRNRIITCYRDLLNAVQDELLMEDLPLEISFDTDLKKLFKFGGLHFNKTLTRDPYGIIETVLRIHDRLDLKSTVVFSNVAHYLDVEQFNEISKLCLELKKSIIFIEFCSHKDQVVYGDAKFSYIDEDLVDWY